MNAKGGTHDLRMEQLVLLEIEGLQVVRVEIDEESGRS